MTYMTTLENRNILRECTFNADHIAEKHCQRTAKSTGKKILKTISEQCQNNSQKQCKKDTSL